MKNIPMPEMNEKQIERFWNKVQKGEKCWEWIGSIDVCNYGIFDVNQNRFKAHRLAFYLYYKEDPSPLHVCHNCDNPKCVNPLHLFKGTDKDNIHDCISKGRNSPPPIHSGDEQWTRKYPDKVLRGDNHPSRLHPEKLARGSNNYNSKLKEEDVIKIIEMIKQGKSNNKIAIQFNVHKSTIKDILYNRSWKHISRN